MIIAYILFRSLSQRRRSHWYIWFQRQSAHYSLRGITLHLQAEVRNLMSSYLDGPAINTAGVKRHTSAISHLNSHEYTSEPVAAFARIPRSAGKSARPLTWRHALSRDAATDTYLQRRSYRNGRPVKLHQASLGRLLYHHQAMVYKRFCLIFLPLKDNKSPRTNDVASCLHASR